MKASVARAVIAALWLLIHARVLAQETSTPPVAETSAPLAQEAPAEAATAPGIQHLTEEELNSLGLDETDSAVDLSLKLSGFADVGFGMLFAPEDSFWRASGVVPARPTFYVGNLNVYLSKQLTSTLNTMAEIRFSYLPNGSGAFGFEKPQNTTANDYADFGRATRWGSIILQRVYVEWQPSSLFAIRGGQFLSPYGVWNVDHGSPVVIPVRRPWIIGAGWIPEKQTGLELFGRARLSSANELGYHLTLSNGVGPISEYADLDDNKAVGGRVYWGFFGLGRLRVGASAYYGRVTDALFRVTVSGTTDLSSAEVIATQYDSLTWAGDATWDVGGLHVQTEGMFNQNAYTTKGRAAKMGIGGTSHVPSDVSSWGIYGLIGYRLPWFGIMPFVLCEHVDGDVEGSRSALTVLQFGLNIRPVGELVLKVQYDHVSYDDGILDSMDILMVQAAWAF